MDHVGAMLTIRPFTSSPVARICRVDAAPSVVLGVTAMLAKRPVSDIACTEHAEATTAATAIAA